MKSALPAVSLFTRVGRVPLWPKSNKPGPPAGPPSGPTHLGLHCSHYSE